MTAKIDLIDADAHVNTPPTFWHEYLPKHLRELAPRIEEGTEAEGHDWLVFEGARKPLSSLSTTAGKKVEEYRRNGRLSDLRKGN